MNGVLDLRFVHADGSSPAKVGHWVTHGHSLRDHPMLRRQQTEFPKSVPLRPREHDNALFGERAAMHMISADIQTRGSVAPEAGLWLSAFLSREERRALEDAVASLRSIGAHHDLVGERDRAESLFLIKHGWACRYAMTPKGGRQFLALLVPGDLCNLDSLLFDRLDYGIRTLTQATIVALPRDRAVALATQHPGIARMFTRRALLDNAILAKLALALGRRSAKERLAHLLCELSVRLGMKNGGETSFEFPLTQEQIADAIGLTAVHVNRIIQLLRSEGLISVAQRVMTIRNVTVLRQIGGFDPSYLHIEQSEVASVNQVVSPGSSSS